MVLSWRIKPERIAPLGKSHLTLWLVSTGDIHSAISNTISTNTRTPLTHIHFSICIHVYIIDTIKKNEHRCHDHPVGSSLLTHEVDPCHKGTLRS